MPGRSENRSHRPPRDDDGGALLREHVAGLESRLRALTSESVSPLPPPYLTPAELYDDWPGARHAYASGFPQDRRYGQNFPLIRHEQDLRVARATSRMLADTNPLCIGFLDHITNFVVGTGFKWDVGLKGVKGDDDQRDPDAQACQQVLDEFRQLAGWGDDHCATAGDDLDTDDSPTTDLESETWRSAMRDGESFLRLFQGGGTTNGVPTIRKINPECIYCPPGENPQSPWSFGVETDAEDRQTRLRYHVADPDKYPADGEKVPAGRILHLKLNADADVKRGVPDFWPLEHEATHLRRLWQNMTEVSAVLSAIAYIRQHAPGVSPTQIRAMNERIQSGSDTKTAKWHDPYQGPDQYRTYTRHEAGTIIDVTNAMQYEAGPINAGSPGFISTMQASLRIFGLRWGCPEYFSGDASNANFASTLVAGGPFERAAQRRQQIFKRFQGNLAMRVLLFAAEAGRLTRRQVARIEVKVTPPGVAIANKAEDTQRRATLFAQAGLSAKTWLTEEGYDPEQEKANKANEQPPPQQPGGGGAPVPGQPTPPAGGGGGTDIREQPTMGDLFESVRRLNEDTSAETVPPELLAAILTAHARGDADAVAQLLELADDPALLAAVLDGPPDGTTDLLHEATRDRSHLVFDKVKHRWVNPNKQPYQRKTPAGEMTPKEQLVARKAAAEPARQAARQAWGAVASDPSKVTAADLAGLADHLHALTRDELREVARAIQKKVGGLKRELVDRLLTHVGASPTQDGGKAGGGGPEVKPTANNLFGDEDESHLDKMERLAVRAGLVPDGEIIRRKNSPDEQRDQLYTVLAASLEDEDETLPADLPGDWPKSLHDFYQAEYTRREDEANVEYDKADAAEKELEARKVKASTLARITVRREREAGFAAHAKASLPADLSPEDAARFLDAAEKGFRRGPGAAYDAKAMRDRAGNPRVKETEASRRRLRQDADAYDLAAKYHHDTDVLLAKAEMEAGAAEDPEAAKFTGTAANGVRYVDGVAQKGEEEPTQDGGKGGPTGDGAKTEPDKTAGMDTPPPAPPAGPEPEPDPDDSLARQPGETPLDYLRRAVPRMAHLPNPRDVQAALAELKGDQIPEAETLLGTKRDGYEMSPHSHLSRRFGELYSHATARRGHAARLANAKELLAGAETAADPAKHQREWDDLFDVMKGMTGKRMDLLAADLGIEPELIQGEASVSGPLERAMRAKLQPAIDRKRLAAVVADPKKYGFAKRDVANPEGLAFLSRELYSRGGQAPSETFAPGQVLTANGRPHVVVAAAKPSFTSGYRDGGEQVGPNSHRQNLLLRPASEADVIGQRIRELEKQHGTYSRSSDSVLDHSAELAKLRAERDGKTEPDVGKTAPADRAKELAAEFTRRLQSATTADRSDTIAGIGRDADAFLDELDGQQLTDQVWKDLALQINGTKEGTKAKARLAIRAKLTAAARIIQGQRS